MKSILSLIALSMTIVSCAPDTAQEVIDETFINIVEGTWRDSRIYTIPCKSNLYSLDAEGKLVVSDSAAFITNSENCNKKIGLLQKDTIGLVVGIYITPSDRNIYQIDLEEHSNNKFVFVNDSMPMTHGREKIPQFKKYTGMLRLSNFHINPDNNTATLNVDYVCGFKCGFEYKVQLKKHFLHWKIWNIEELAIF
jgi:hypothetical protein